jgi:hypothetical protein
VTGSWSFWSLKSSKAVFCYRFSQKLLGQSTPTFGIMFLLTTDMHNKLLVAIHKRAPEPLPVHEKSLKNKNDLCSVFETLKVVSTNHYAFFCKISSCSGDRKLVFLKPKEFKHCFLLPYFSKTIGPIDPYFWHYVSSNHRHA